MVFDTVRTAVRSLRRSPVFSVTTIAIVALATGGAGALLSLLNAVVLRPLPVREPNRLVLVTPGRGEVRFGFNGATLTELRRQQTPFEDVCGFSRGGVRVDIPGLPPLLSVEGISDNCDALLGRKAFMGRLLDERDRGLAADAPGVAVISYDFWKRTLNSDPQVIGRVLATPRLPLTIVGVSDEAGGALDADTGAQLTVTLSVQAQLAGSRNVLVVDAVGRLRPGVSLGQAETAIRSVWPSVWSAVNTAPAGAAPPASRADALRIESLAGGLSTLRFRYANALKGLTGLASLLLALACMNVGGLLLARRLSRDHEVHVFLALGAAPGQLIGQCIAESAILSSCATAIAAVIAWLGSQALAVFVWSGTSDLAMRVTPDAWVWWTIVAVGVCVGLVSTVPAVVHLARRASTPAARAGTSSYATSAAATRARRTLIVLQVAASFVLLFCASLFARNLVALRALDPGYDPAPIRWTAVTLRFGQPVSIDHVAYFRPILDRLASVPGVKDAALSTPFPQTELRHVVGRPPFSRPDIPNGQKVGGQVNWVSPGFFKTVGVTVRSGREFEWSDDASHPPVAVISESVAAVLFPQGDAVGRTVRIDDLTLNLTVVGVVGDASPGDVRLTHLPRIYRSLSQDTALMMTPNIILRVNGGTGLTDQVRGVVDEAGRHQVRTVQTIEDQTKRFLLRERLLTEIGRWFAILSVCVGGLGLYALMADASLRRRREVGIRRALGASRTSTIRVLAFSGGQLVLGGLALGAPAAIFIGGRLAELLTSVAPTDAASLWIAAAASSAWGAVVCLIPAWRIARTGIVDALRAE